jgi:hypothetical protein
MANHLFDQHGNSIGSVKTDAEVGNEAMGAFMVLVAPFSPILWLAWKAGAFLVDVQHWHPVPSIVVGLAIVGVCLYALYRSIWIRYIYFGCLTAALAGLVGWWVNSQSDIVWACTAAVAVAALGGFLTHWAARLEDLPR